MDKVMKGIDLSYHEGTVDWGAVKGNIDFAIIRAGYGKNNIDTQAKNNIKGCQDNGIPFGLYWFSYAYTVEMAKQEAKYLIEFAKDCVPLMPVYFDFEYDSDRWAMKKGAIITPELLHQMATAFCEELENAGYYVGIYANNDYIVEKYGESIFKTYDLWYARWAVDTPDRSANLWQYTDKGVVPGINGYVDMNYAYTDYPAIIKKYGFNGYKVFKCPHGCPHCPHSNK